MRRECSVGACSTLLPRRGDPLRAVSGLLRSGGEIQIAAVGDVGCEPGCEGIDRHDTQIDATSGAHSH
jgi:hypothetical protein